MSSLTPTTDPTITPPTAAKAPSLQSGIGCCLSGGGYRAMLFHAGSLWRLNEAGLLPGLTCVYRWVCLFGQHAGGTAETKIPLR